MESIRFDGLGDPRTTRVPRAKCRIGPNAVVIFDSPDMNWNDINELLQVGDAYIGGFLSSSAGLIEHAMFNGDVHAVITGSNVQTFSIEGQAEVKLGHKHVEQLFKLVRMAVADNDIVDDPLLWPLMTRSDLLTNQRKGMKAISDSDMLTEMYIADAPSSITIHVPMKLAMEKP